MVPALRPVLPDADAVHPAKNCLRSVYELGCAGRARAYAEARDGRLQDAGHTPPSPLPLVLGTPHGRGGDRGLGAAISARMWTRTTAPEEDDGAPVRPGGGSCCLVRGWRRIRDSNS